METVQSQPTERFGKLMEVHLRRKIHPISERSCQMVLTGIYCIINSNIHVPLKT